MSTHNPSEPWSKAAQKIKELADTKLHLEVACAERDSLKAEVEHFRQLVKNTREGFLKELGDLQWQYQQQLAACRAALVAAERVIDEVDLHHGVLFSGTTEDQVRDALAKIDAALESAGPPPKPPIHWNPGNKVVQDHRDGTIIQPDTDIERAKRGLPVPWHASMGEVETKMPDIP